MTTMNMLSVMPIIMLVTMTMVGGACAFSFNGSSGNMLTTPRAPLDTRCAATIAGDSKWCPQSSSRTNSPHLGHHRQLAPPLFARRRRGSSADDEDDEYDDDYIDDLINEKFDDDFDDDDEFIIDAEVEESSIAGADKDDDREYEYARVGRRRGRGADRYEGSDGSRGDGDSDGPSSSSSRREQRRRRSYAGDDVDQYDGYDAEFDEEDDEYEEDYDEDYDSDDDVDDDDDDDDDFEEGILIPNPILDSVDPEGASERIGELFEDPKFLKDMAVVAFVVWVVYFLTFDATDLIPWDIMKPEDFPLESLYEKR